MARRKADLTQADVTGYAKAMRSAGFEHFRVELEKPDGTRLSIIAGLGGEAVTAPDAIDAMIARAK